MSSADAPEAMKDPLEDISSLVEQTMSILNPGAGVDQDTGDVPLNNGGRGHPLQLGGHGDKSPLGDASTATAHQDFDVLGLSNSPPSRFYPSQRASSAPFEEQSLSEPSPAAFPSTNESQGDGNSISHEASHTSADEFGSPSPGSDVLIRIWVKEPEKIETTSALGIKSHYISYLIRTDSKVPGMRAEGMEVRRRFSEFDALHKVLRFEYQGYVIPPLPEKSFIDGKIARDDFLRLRRADLQAFLRGLAMHPVLCQSEALKTFLLQPGELSRNPAWLALVNPLPKARFGSTSSAASEPTTSGSDSLAGTTGSVATGVLKASVGTWMSWMRQSVFTPPKRELPEDEITLRQNKELMKDLERLLQLSCESARVLCGHMDQLCADFHELGRNMGMLSRFEETVQARAGSYTEAGHSAANRAADLQKVALCNAKQHTVWRTLSLKTAASLVTLHDYYILVPEVIAALEEREAALSHLQQLEDELAHKRQQLEQVKASSPTKGAAVSASEKKAYQLNHAIGQLEEQIKTAQQQYNLIKERNQSELSRLSLERESDFRRMLQMFAATQAQLVQASADLWNALSKQFAEQK